MLALSCSQAVRQNNEPLYASCGQFDHLVFVSWPAALWHPKSVLNSEGVPADLAPWLGDQARKGVKMSLRFFDDGQHQRDRVTLKLYPEAQELAGVPRKEIAAALSRRLGGDDSGWQAILGREFFICTHGSHDQCCGIFGDEIFNSASALITDRNLPIRAYRCSHLGGHRFAATGFIFPEGHLYGRIDSSILSDLFSSAIRGEVFAPCYRGTIWHSRDEQLAIYAAAAADPTADAAKVKLIEVKEEGETLKTIFAETAGTPAKKFSVALERKSFAGPESCDAIGQPRQTSRWVIT